MKIIDHPLTDAQIIASLQEDKSLEATVRYLYKTHFTYMTNFIRRNSGTRQDAEDYFHEMLVVFIELVRQGKFRAQSSIKTFLYAILRNLWCNELKRRSRAQFSVKQYFESREQTAKEVQQLYQHDSEIQMLDLIEQLQESYRKILLLYYYEEMPMKQISEVMGYKSEQVVRNMKCKGMKKLNELLHSQRAVKQACYG